MSVQPIRASGREQAAGWTPARRGMIDRLAIAAINGYQRHISPRKGYRCAHHKLHGQDSCSQYIKRIVEQDGLGHAIHLAPARFRACGAASRMLRAEMIAPDGDSPDTGTGGKRKIAWGNSARGDGDDGCTTACCVAEMLTDLPCCTVLSLFSLIFP